MPPLSTLVTVQNSAPQKKTFSFANPHQIRTPFNNYYYPIHTNPQGQTTLMWPQTLPLLHYMHGSLLLQKILTTGWAVAALCMQTWAWQVGTQARVVKLLKNWLHSSCMSKLIPSYRSNPVRAQLAQLASHSFHNPVHALPLLIPTACPKK